MTLSPPRAWPPTGPPPSLDEVRAQAREILDADVGCDLSFTQLLGPEPRTSPHPLWCRVAVAEALGQVSVQRGLAVLGGADVALRERRMLGACLAVAAAQRFLDVATEHTHRREAFGVPLYKHQGVRLRLAEVRTRVEAVRRLAYRAVHAGACRSNDAEAFAMAALTKAGQLVCSAAEECMFVHGAHGYLESHAAPGFVAEARAFAAAVTGGDWMPNDVVAPRWRTAAASGDHFRERVRSVVRSVVAQRVAGWLSGPVLPVQEVLAVLADEGVLGAGFLSELAGDGGDIWQSVVLHEELARLGCSALSTAVLSHLEVGTRLVLDHGSPAAVERWVGPALRGDAVLGYAATEPGAGSDLAATTTSARRSADGWVLDGAKTFISNGHQADALCVLVRTSDRGVTSHTLLLVPMAAEGVKTRPLASVGNRGTLAEVAFEGVYIDSDAVIGVEGQGLLLQIRRLAHERAFVAVMLAALAETTCASEPELVADVEEARSLAYHAVATLAAGRDARVPAAMAKLTAARALRAVAGRHLPSESANHPASMQAYLDALGFAFAGGTDTMLLEAIAR